MRIEERLYTLRYKRDEKPHLSIIEPNKCQKCAEINGVPEPCIVVCPANVYSWVDNNRIVVSYENCVECGACRIACPFDNISWKYPRYGLGVAFRYG
ncbi:ferredoxin family protein [Sulfolobus acidocaldarius]|uniref:Ferredoxin-like protein n=4 Tax=Sulfolobus acidocaldarius TaxID=2285 RepID=Q4JBU6_SULAC|nr:ferredoxin family protein [Sulfolobus acidocaldarius]AAY79733.1 ferredoxin-like protein [Sulfolobus acidocaldarius DSM 639]AGE70292.1 4Fe-4S ferredoxin iron-sulfur binding domain protein [Sulfolobus acidocaldarius N8]AGE72567.1 4Fe-4S ferredoxin iron-sulfur binding domain protein [Sulfolobus acidocaldarius Ron12/I]ALU29307.1 4Fe-4S ferredoxin [Sulfolobus acidocaldarius]ALU32036.1 4Fe-4S ferredoxin [Sulfolobus acidocaldarius]